jgi:hypothetical protein
MTSSTILNSLCSNFRSPVCLHCIVPSIQKSSASCSFPSHFFPRGLSGFYLFVAENWHPWWTGHGKWTWVGIYLSNFGPLLTHKNTQYISPDKTDNLKWWALWEDSYRKQLQEFILMGCSRIPIGKCLSNWVLLNVESWWTTNVSSDQICSAQLKRSTIVRSHYLWRFMFARALCLLDLLESTSYFLWARALYFLLLL